MTQIVESLQLHPVVPNVIGFWVLILALCALIYLVPKFLFRKPLPLRLKYLFSPFDWIWIPFVELGRPPWWRKKWLERSGVIEGAAVLEEGFGFGTSPLIAARMVGPKGKLYALDVAPVHVAVLRVRAKLYRLRNLEVILADAKCTGLPDKSVDVVFMCYAFHHFWDKEGTLKELHRVLREDGTLSMLEDRVDETKKAVKLAEESGLFHLLEQDGKFCRFRRTGREAWSKVSILTSYVQHGARRSR